MRAVNPVLDSALAPRFFPIVYASIRRGQKDGEPVWVAAGWLHGNPRIGIVIVRPIVEGSAIAFSQLMFCLGELEKEIWATDNNLNFRGPNVENQS